MKKIELLNIVYGKSAENFGSYPEALDSIATADLRISGRESRIVKNALAVSALASIADLFLMKDIESGNKRILLDESGCELCCCVGSGALTLERIVSGEDSFDIYVNIEKNDIDMIINDLKSIAFKAKLSKEHKIILSSNPLFRFIFEDVNFSVL